MKTVEIFCQVHDFWREFQPQWRQCLLTAGCQRLKPSRLCMSEVMTILIMFHLSGYRTFKDYYQQLVLSRWRHDFPGLVSYSRFTELAQRALVPLALFLLRKRVGHTQGVAFVDSTALAVCQNPRIHRHKLFSGSAQRGRTSVGWFYGFKLHLVINHEGELLSFCLTPGNTDDRKPLDQLTRGMWGWLFADKGYVSQSLQERLRERNLRLVTKLRGNMKRRLLPLWQRLMLRKRALIESVIDFLKNTCQIQHTRHRSRGYWLANLLSGLAAYSFLPKKPALKLNIEPQFKNLLCLI